VRITYNQLGESDRKVWRVLGDVPSRLEIV